MLRLAATCLVLLGSAAIRAGEPDKRFPLYAYLTGRRRRRWSPTRRPNSTRGRRRTSAGSPTSSIRADLKALRPAFDGLVLYGYHEACTPRVLAVAKELKFRAVLLAIWDPKSAAEVDGVAAAGRSSTRRISPSASSSATRGSPSSATSRRT